MELMSLFFVSSIISFLVSSPFFLSLYVKTIFAPIFAKPMAVALPMPDVAPVIKTTFPFMPLPMKNKHVNQGINICFWSSEYFYIGPDSAWPRGFCRGTDKLYNNSSCGFPDCQKNHERGKSNKEIDCFCHHLKNSIWPLYSIFLINCSISV